MDFNFFFFSTTENILLDDIDIAIRNDRTHETILKPIKVIETKYNDVALIKVKHLRLLPSQYFFHSYKYVFVIYAIDGKFN